MSPVTAAPGRLSRRIAPLENGDHLSASEFLRRYEAMPGLKKAELIQGIVFLASPVRASNHGEPDNLIQGWLCTYAAAHPDGGFLASSEFPGLRLDVSAALRLDAAAVLAGLRPV